MAKFIRYALASVCFAASVGCLAFWGWTVNNESTNVIVRYFSSKKNANDESSMFVVEMMQGEAIFRKYEAGFVARGWEVDSTAVSPFQADAFRDRLSKLGLFFVAEPWIYFPLWYPALIFALAGGVALRFRRQFSIRSALIATTVVAALIGMAAML